MRSSLTFFIATSIFVSAGFLTGCRDEPKFIEKQIVVYRPVNTWSGTGSLQTESFAGEGSFRLEWESRPEPGSSPATLLVTLHSAVSGRPLTVLVEHEGAGKNTALASEDPREFFLVIEGKHTAWTVKLEEGIGAISRQPIKD